MTKQKILILIPLIIIATIIVYCWITLLTTETIGTWKHYLGLLFFLLICTCFFIDFKIATVATGIFLLLGTINLLAFTPSVSTYGIHIGSVKTPGIQGLAMCLFILYFILNMDTLINFYLDFKENKKS